MHKAAAVALTLAFPLTAAAAVPQISGSYVYTRTTFCNTPELGAQHFNAYADFDADTNIVTIDGYFVSGGSFQSATETAEYSNTGTTVTIDGVVYKAFYGKPNNGITTYFSLLGTIPITGGNCTLQIILSRKGA